VTQDRLGRRAEFQEFQWAALVEMPDLVRCDLMSAAKATLWEKEVDCGQRSTKTASIQRGDLNFGTEYLPIETALGMRPQIQRGDQLSGSWVHYTKRLLVTASPQRPVCQKRCQRQNGAHDEKETVRVLGQGNTTYIHAKQPCHQVDRQG
jgi:hypothetical protein